MAAVITEPDEATPAWLSHALDRDVRAVTSVERIGTGQMSRNFRLGLDSDGLSSVVLKIPAEDTSLRDLVSSVYLREVGFYARLASQIDGRFPACHYHASSETGAEFTLLLADIAPSTQGDQLQGCSISDAKLALENLARLHASSWNHPSLHTDPALEPSDSALGAAIYAMAHDQFKDNYQELLAPGTAEILDTFRHNVESWMDDRPGPSVLIHGDYRLDNLLFGNDGVTAVDWQTIDLGPPGRDVAFFLGNSLTIENRQNHETELLEFYRSALGERGIDYSTEELVADYRLGAWLGPYVTVLGAFAATRTTRGDEMFIAMADRSASQISSWFK